MKKTIFAFVFFASFAITTAFAYVGPTCDFNNCPGGNQKCCTEDGVTLYNNSNQQLQ